MTKNRGWLIHLDTEHWCLADAPAAQTTFAVGELAQQASLIQASLLEDGYTGEPVVISLAASRCLAASIEVPSPQKCGRDGLGGSA